MDHFDTTFLFAILLNNEYAEIKTPQKFNSGKVEQIHSCGVERQIIQKYGKRRFKKTN